MFKSIALVALAALSLSACSKKEAPINNDNEQITLKFNIRNADDATTRALLGDDNGKKFLNWENGDLIGSFATGTFGNTSTSNNNSGTVEVSGDSYTLNIKTFNTGTATNLYTYFPFSASAGKSSSAAVVTIPATQEMTADGFDADAMPMAGTPVEVDLEIAEANKDVPCGEINFFNLGSIINFRIYSSVATEETLTSVKYISGSSNIGGEYTIDLTAVSSNEETLSLVGDGSESEITTLVSTHPTIGTGKNNAIDVYMVVAPGTYSGTQVVVTTSAKTYTLNASGAKTYTRSSVKPMAVDIQNGTPGDLPVEENWVKVSSVADFTPGTYYILNWDEGKYLPNDEAGSAPTAKDFKGTVTVDMRWVATSSNGGLVFKNPNSELYLWGQDGTNNGVRVKKSAPASASANVWKATANTKFGILASVGTSRYLATYNNNGTQQDWRNYQSGSLGDGTNTNSTGEATAAVNNYPAVFYKLVEPGKETPTLSFDNPTTTVNIGAKVTNVAAITPSTLTIEYSSSNPNIASVNEATGEVTGVAAGSATITASFAGDASYYAVSAEYTIKVIDPDANDGSEAKPYTASEAAAAALAGDTDEVYVIGIISKITNAYNATYGQVSFDISNDGKTTSTQFRIYRAEATSADDFKVGEAVEFKGNLTTFTSNNNTVPELNEGNELISQVHLPSFTPDGALFTSDSQEVSISGDTDATIRYTTDGTDPTISTGSVYQSTLTLSATTTVKAIAVKGKLATAVVTAVFTKSDNTDAVYSLYSGNLTEGDYVIYYSGRAMKNTVSSNRLEYAEVTPSDNKIINPDASIVWHIAPSGDYWTIYNSAVEKYAAGNGTKNQAALNASATDDGSLWTVSGDSTYEFVNKKNAANKVNCNLRNNSTYGFACYGTGTGGALSLYKLN